MHIHRRADLAFQDSVKRRAPPQARTTRLAQAVSAGNSKAHQSVVIPEAIMMPFIGRSAALVGVLLLTAASGRAWPQPSGTQPVPRDDPATSGAGPTSSAPGQYNYDPPKSGSVTIDSRGVTTTQPTRPHPQTTDAPKGIGNGNAGASASK